MNRTRLILSLFAIVGCAPTTTQIVLVIDSDIPVPSELSTIELELASGRTAPLHRTIEFSSDGPMLPLSLALVPQGDTRTDVVVAVRARAPGGSLIVSRRVRTRFVPGSGRLLRIQLARQCATLLCTGADETCDETGCRPVVIEGPSLPVWSGSVPSGASACLATDEQCDGFDDDCDGSIDETFDLSADLRNCGRCGVVCPEGSTCSAGFCAGTKPSALAVGGMHGCVIDEAKHLACWGSNVGGEIGVSPPPQAASRAVRTAIEAEKVSCGAAHTCVLQAGALRCFGIGGSGQLGSGQTSDSSEPVVVPIVASVDDVSAGVEHTCAVDQNGSAFCWGANDHGQLGNGATALSAMPVGVVGLGSGVRAISAGYRSSCAVIGSGNVVCWGANDRGQLGDGTANPSSTPVAVSSLTDAVSVHVGREHACARRQAGEVVCWGANDFAQLGNDTLISSNVPVPVASISGATALAVAAGGHHSCAVVSSAVWCWGSNASGQLGDGSTTASMRPAAVRGLSGVMAVSVGSNEAQGTGYSCALASSGAVDCWGDGRFGRLGNGSTFDRSEPVSAFP